MFYIEKATHSHVLITSDDDRECAFPIDIFEKSKKQKPRDVKRNRKIAIINDTQHTFKQKEWKDAAQLTEYQIVRDDYETEVKGYYKTCVILSSENDFVIMPVDDLKKAQVRNHQKPKCEKNGVNLLIKNQLYHFSFEQWSYADLLAKTQQISYMEFLKLNRVQIRQQIRMSRRQAKQKAYR